MRQVPHLRNSIAYDHDFRYLCKMMISPGVFLFLFLFFLNNNFQAVSGLKGQKMTQNDKNFCLSRFISQEPYII